jgi:hypothetical protein
MEICVVKFIGYFKKKEVSRINAIYNSSYNLIFASLATK